MNYIIVKSDDLYKLEKEVNLKLKDGYEPLGGIAININRIPTSSDSKLFAQALIKK